MIMFIRGNRQNRTKASAFTLIELLVVIGLIALLAGGVGIAMRGNNPTATLRSAQGLLSSALAAGRGQAALTQSNAELLVEADNIADESFLRRIIVVVNGNTQVGPDIMLPQGAYVVPPATITGVSLVEADGAGTWPDSRRSSFFTSRALRSVNGISKNYLIPSGSLTALGTVSAGSGGKIVVGMGRLTSGTTLEISNPEAARGILVSRYGVATPINDAESLD